MQARLNGKWIDSSFGSVSIADRGFRYGAGLFETIRFENDRAPLWDRHLRRLTRSLTILNWSLPALLTPDRLQAEIIQTIQKNKLSGSVRVRVTLTHGEGGLFDGDRKINVLIETWPLDPSRKEFNTNGWVMGFFEGGQKSTDALSRCKSTSALLYTQAAQFAKQQKWNDALVFNAEGALADSCLANLFLVKEGKLFTTDSDQGAVEGVMQAWWIDQLSSTMPVLRGRILPNDLLKADEVFLTNALFGIRWVGRIGDRSYQNILSQTLYQRHLRTIFP